MRAMGMSSYGNGKPLKMFLKFGEIPFLLVLGYVIVALTADPHTQDAFQYRLNFQQGRYESFETGGYFGLIVTWINGLMPSFDPFFVIGGVTAAVYMWVALRAKSPTLKYLIFIVLLFMPLLGMNLTQVLRQGLASAFILVGLTVGSSLLFASLLIAGALIHKVFAPIVILVLLRELLFRRRGSDLGGEGAAQARRTRGQMLFDRLVFAAVPIFCLLVYMLSSNVFYGIDSLLQYAGEETAGNLYFTFDASNAKRVLVSVMLLVCVRLIYPSLESRLSTFMAYITVSVAMVLPFTFDFLRMHTVVVPFIVLAALTHKKGKNGYFALAVCMIVSLYVAPAIGFYRIL